MIPSSSSLNLANVTAGVIGAIVVLLIVMSAIAVIIVIVIVCINRRNRKKGASEGNGEADNTDHYYSVATENTVPKPPRIQGDNKNDMIVYDQVEGGGLNSTDTNSTDPDAGVKVHNKKTNAMTSGNGKQKELMNDPSELYTELNKARKPNEELDPNHDQVDLDELYTQPDKKKKIKKPPPYASRREGDDPEALYTAVDKVKKGKN